ncbi:hypothetical protein GH714_011906 [Hevea brasiliensis]|uniref:RING-type E3 ubiquitin transferase n=1 Tax=Hevea brasiliensis TaxID=3981 RepID=A0A6A6KD02_HEVBR|nr:hypothetical protein GH714_011906 [Hevea brasiliensis]
MASSLEDLLVEEGFRGRRSGMTSRASFRAEAVIKSLHPSRDKSKTDSPSGLSGRRIKTERTRSDVSRYILRGELPRSDSSLSRRPRDNLVSREKIDGKSKIETWERPVHRVSNDVQNNKTLNSEGIDGCEITEIGVEEDERVKDIYSDRAYSERSEKSSEGNRGKQMYIERKGNNIKVDQTGSSNSNKNLLKYTAFTDSNKKTMRQPDPSYDSSIRSSKNAKNFEDDQGMKHENLSLPFSKLALDEVAVRAMVSILNGYIKRFLKDEEFRSTLCHNCFSSLNFIENGQDHNIKSKVITNLEQAIEIVEKVTEEAASTKDLKKASLQLRMITSLNSNGLKDGYTSGIPNSRLSACAHLYLSVIYKLQKKDRVSARYLLQVFCDSPFPARTLLLPELWDYLFFPHLSHLKGWYNQEADSLLNTPSKMRKLKLLDKVYNEILDSSTYQLAVYYKDWLTEGVEAPSLPSIHIPTLSVQEVQQADSQDHSSVSVDLLIIFSPQPMDHGLLSASKEEWKLIKVSAFLEADINSKRCNSNGQEETAGDGHMPVNALASYEELDGTYEYFDKGSFLASIPEDFTCPLSGKLFEEPVTLETGQTFEKEVIREWFNLGNRTCPSSIGSCLSIFRNSGKHDSRQRDETAMLILERLLTTFRRKERLANAKHLVSIGGLEFLIRRIKLGNVEEKREWRKDVKLFLSGLQNEEIMNAMHILLMYLQNSPPEQRPWVALLLLHLDLLEDEETIDEWLRNLSTSLLGNGRKSFLEVISKCLASGNLDLVKACLTTIAWLSCALSALSDAEFHLSAFSALISNLKESLENGHRIEHKVLASMSLLNFSKIPECRVFLMTIAEEIAVPLQSLVESTWTAKQLYAIISGEYV